MWGTVHWCGGQHWLGGSTLVWGGTAASLEDTTATAVPAARNGLACLRMGWRKELLFWLLGTTAALPGSCWRCSPRTQTEGQPPEPLPPLHDAGSSSRRALSPWAPSPRRCVLAAVPPAAGPGRGRGCPKGCSGVAPARLPRAQRLLPAPKVKRGRARGLSGDPGPGWLWRGFQGQPEGRGRAGMGREVPGLGRAGSRVGDDVWADVSDRTR